MEKIERIKKEIFGTDIRYALENCNGLLWGNPDQETVEEFIKTPFESEQKEKDGLEIQVNCWLSGLSKEKELDGYEREHTFIKEISGTDATLTDEEFDKLCDLIVDDIYNYHEQSLLESIAVK